MKYILMMSGTKAGVSGYHTWSQSDRDTHMQTLGAIVKDLVETGEFVATPGWPTRREATVVRGEKNGLPVTDGIFPEAKEFLLGYWIVDVANARARVRHRGPDFGGARTGRYSDEHARSRCGSSCDGGKRNGCPLN